MRLSPIPANSVKVKVDTERVSVILITPFWPKRAWLSTILQMAVQTILAALNLAGFTTAGSRVLPGCSQAKPHRLVSEEQLLGNKGLSEPLITTLLSSRKKVTRTIFTLRFGRSTILGVVRQIELWKILCQF